jgi:hypothetical protein
MLLMKRPVAKAEVKRMISNGVNPWPGRPPMVPRIPEIEAISVISNHNKTRKVLSFPDTFAAKFSNRIILNSIGCHGTRD